MRITEISPSSAWRIGGIRATMAPAHTAHAAWLAPQPPASNASAKKRVAAYCRVSTDRVDQETSFEAQQSHFSSLIDQNPSWELVDIYADEESGIRTNRRDNFMRMVADCEANRIDMVLTKSISRFARNTLDCLEYIRKLKAMGIPILFTKEGINTMDAGGEVLITVLASIAQQESASISQNVQIGMRYHFQEGKVCAGVYRLLGYERTREGSLRIIAKEAAIVQQIFRDYLDGFSTKNIARRLREDEVDATKVTASGIALKRNWNYAGIAYILANEKYTGDLILQKYYTVDYLTKKTARNTGQLPQYYVEGSHEPIVPRDIYLQVQTEMMRRKKHWREFRHSLTIAMAGKVECGCCGSPYRRAGGKGVWWRCETRMKRRLHEGVACNMGSVREAELRDAVMRGLALVPMKREELVRLEERLRWCGMAEANRLLEELEAELSTLEASANADGSGSTLDGRYEELRDRWTVAAERRADYASQPLHVRNLLDLTGAMEGTEDASQERVRLGMTCATERDFYTMTRPSFCADAYSEDYVVRYVDKLVVCERAIGVYFKAGVSVEVERGSWQKQPTEQQDGRQASKEHLSRVGELRQ